MAQMRAHRLIFTGYSVRRNGNGGGNFSVESVFYEREYKLNRDGQAGDIGDPAATRELFAGSFCHLNDSVDGGISFLLFVEPVYGCIRGDDAGGARATGAGLKRIHHRDHRVHRGGRE
jgi:hypothetical protein